MKSIPLTNLIEQAVLDEMRVKASFTALDISNRLKFERYPVQHRAVAETVREIYHSGAMTFYDYERRLIPVVTDGGAKQTHAFLYHFQEVRPRTYRMRRQDALPPVAPDRAKDLADSVHASPIPVLHRPVRPVSPQRQRTRRDGALGISRSLLAQLGWTDGTRLAVTMDGGHLVLSASTAGEEALTVWAGQRLRICRTKLRVGALTAEKVRVEIEGKQLKITTSNAAD